MILGYRKMVAFPQLLSAWLMLYDVVCGWWLCDFPRKTRLKSLRVGMRGPGNRPGSHSLLGGQEEEREGRTRYQVLPSKVYPQ